MQIPEIPELLQDLDTRRTGGIISNQICKDKAFGPEQVPQDLQRNPSTFYVRKTAEQITRSLEGTPYCTQQIKPRNSFTGNNEDTGLFFGEGLLITPDYQQEVRHIEDFYSIHLQCIADTSWNTLAEAHICPLNSLQQDLQGNTYDPLGAVQEAENSNVLQISPNTASILAENPENIYVYYQSLARFHELEPVPNSQMPRSSQKSYVYYQNPEGTRESNPMPDQWMLKPHTEKDLPRFLEHLVTDYAMPIPALEALESHKWIGMDKICPLLKDRLTCLIQYQDPLNPELWKLARKHMLQGILRPESPRLTLQQRLVRQGLKNSQAQQICDETQIPKEGDRKKPPYTLEEIREQIQRVEQVSQNIYPSPKVKKWDLTPKQANIANKITFELWIQSNLTLQESRIPIARITEIARLEPNNIELAAKRIWNHDPSLSI